MKFLMIFSFDLFKIMSYIPSSYVNSAFESFYETVISEPFDCYKDFVGISELSRKLVVAIFGDLFDSIEYSLCEEFIKYCFYSGKSINPDPNNVLNTWEQYIGKDICTTFKSRVEMSLNFHSHESRLFLFYYMEKYFKSLYDARPKILSMVDVERRISNLENVILKFSNILISESLNIEDKSLNDIFSSLPIKTQSDVKNFLIPIFESKFPSSFEEMLNEFDRSKKNNLYNLGEYTKKIIEHRAAYLLIDIKNMYPYTLDNDTTLFLTAFISAYSLTQYINTLEDEVKSYYADFTKEHKEFDNEEYGDELMSYIREKICEASETTCRENWEASEK